MRFTHSLLIAALGVSTAAAALADERFKDEFRQTFQQPPGGRIDVSSFNGRIEIAGWDQNTVEVTGAKHAGSAGDLSLIRVEITQAGNVVTARAYRDGKCNNCGAYFVIRVPRRTELSRVKTSNGGLNIASIDGLADLTTSNGGITLRDLKGRTTATTSNGGIDIERIEGDVALRTSNGGVKFSAVRGAVEAGTSNGTIRGTLAEPHGAPLKFTTSNGSIDLTIASGQTGDIIAGSSNGNVIIRMPAGAGARVDAHTSSHDSIQTDFDVNVQGVLSKGKLQGNIGSGGPLLQLSTSNGSIRILKN